jgi:hypothetical protein
MSKIKAEPSIEEKFSLVVLSFHDYRDEYKIDLPLIDRLSHLHSWQQHLMVKIFVAGSKQKAVEQFPTMEKELILASLKVLVDAAEYVKDIVTNQDKFNTLILNLSEHDFVLDADTRNTIINLLQDKEELANLWKGIKSEEKLDANNQESIGFFENFLSICKELVDMIIKFVEEQVEKVIDFVAEAKEQILSLDCLKQETPEPKEEGYTILGAAVEADE